MDSVRIAVTCLTIFLNICFCTSEILLFIVNDFPVACFCRNVYSIFKSRRSSTKSWLTHLFQKNLILLLSAQVCSITMESIVVL